MTQTWMTHSTIETRDLGQRLARVLCAGDVILLHGDLGAGKSELTRGIAAELGITGPVASPSFTIMNAYDEGRIPLYHFDWYRLNSEEELYELGLDEYLGGDGIAVVEWPLRCPDAIPDTHLDVTIRTVDETTREIVLSPVGGFRALNLND
ncbi:MAG: tRNA (adenosine(37)-N6)-threonylcarbamoyltransferase complex ATPase subunit type 1 TsaE [Clostridia bacterium]|nr:tRNA (adenosine(37)-N6)-threonylcarbamoyltransferase complex ATPase subunit type 1 TsaE [Clostridia bacterium]